MKIPKDLETVPVARKLALSIFWRRFVELGIVPEGELAEEILSEMTDEIENLMRVCREEGFEQAKVALEANPSSQALDI